jgi:hypothetical protein
MEYCDRDRAFARPETSRWLVKKCCWISSTRKLTSAERCCLPFWHYQSALGVLASVNTPAARAASFILVGNSTTPIEALDWLRRVSITLADLDADGKFFVLRKQLDARNWQDALATANTLQPTDFEDAPGLLYLAGGAHLAQAVPEELITLVLWTLPFDAAVLPLADDAAALAQRRKARDYYMAASRRQ